MTSHKMIRRQMLKRMRMTATAVALSACVPVAPGAEPAADSCILLLSVPYISFIKGGRR